MPHLRRRIIVLAMALIVLAGLDMYAFQAVRTALITAPGYEIWTLIYWFVAGLAAICLFIGLTVRRDKWPIWFKVYGPPLLLSIVLGQLVVVVFLFMDDAILLVRQGVELARGHQSDGMGRQPILSWTGLFIGGIPVALLLYGMLRNAYNYKLKEIDLKFKNLPNGLEGLTIVQISDIHSGSLTRPKSVAKAIDMINELNPDIIFFTGDLVNFVASEMDAYIPLFSQLKAKYGVYSITGNHDYGDYVSWDSEQDKADNFKLFMEQHKKMGWRLLMNEHEMLDINGAKLAIIGIENWGASLRFPKYGKLDQAHAGTEEADIRLLLSHDPSHWKAEVIPEYKDIHAVFAGHTHGFQFGVEWGKFRWSPGQYVYAEWAGLYRYAHQYLYVNRGFGYTFYPGRVGILPEISLFTLRSENN